MLLVLLSCKPDLEPTASGLASVAPSPRVYRLTHRQWERSVRDLLFVEDSGYSDGFIGDVLAEGFDNNADELHVGSALFRDYQRAAEGLAKDLVVDADRYELVVPQDPRAGPTGERWSETVLGADGEATTGAASDEAWIVWSDGSWSTTFDVPSSGAYLVQAEVWGSDCGDGVYATMTLTVDGVDVLEEYETAPATETVEVGVELAAGERDVELTFLNDCYDPTAGIDRNLWVEQVTLEADFDPLGESSASAQDAEAWIEDFGERVFRRPLQADEVDDYLALFDAGPELVASGDDFTDGVRLVVTALLQSPHFLYRVESSTEGGQRIPLSDWEIAAKLSYALWGTTPDEALLDLAREGRLHTKAQVEEQAREMLADARADELLLDFHVQLLDLDDYGNIYKSDERWDEGLNEDLREEMERFVEHVVVDEEGGLRALLTSRTTFVSGDLAELYGVSGEGWVEVELDAAERSGLLTRLGFLASEAGASTPSPIHRGVFLNRKVLCTSLPPPPDDVTALPPLEEGTTNRERVDAHTGVGTCGEGCHSVLINPLGYAFEGYDHLGAVRTEDNGQPVDTEASWNFEAGAQDFADAIELSDLIAEAPEAHRCYTSHWLAYTFARAEHEDDADRIEALAEQSRSADLPVTELLVRLVASDEFLCRVPNE